MYTSIRVCKKAKKYFDNCDNVDFLLTFLGISIDSIASVHNVCLSHELKPGSSNLDIGFNNGLCPFVSNNNSLEGKYL